MKTAYVIPIFKKGSAQYVENYRPIPLLSVSLKILEKVVKLRIIKLLENLKLFSSVQFGLRSALNTEMALQKVISQLDTNLNSHNKKSHLIILGYEKSI